jgi:hypothetical protein
MLKSASVIAAGLLVIGILAIAGPAAMAVAPKCKSKANPYVACTDKLKPNTRRARMEYGKIEITYGKKDLHRMQPRLRAQ